MQAPQYDWLRRTIRSFLQGFLGVFIFIGFPALQKIAGGDTLIDVEFWKGVAIACVAGGIVSLVTAVQNLLEDKAGMPAVLKGTAASGANPVPDA